MNRKLTGVLLITTAVLANAAFTTRHGLQLPRHTQGAGRGHPRRFPGVQAAVAGWFAVLALSSALLAPIAVGVGRLSTIGRCASRSGGIAAAVVQVIGLSRWPLLVPGWAADARARIR